VGRSRFCLALLLVATAAVALGIGANAGEPVFGGVFRCAIVADPETLDMQMTTSIPASYPARHMVECLFAFDENYTPQPMLAESWLLDEAGKIAVFTLRKGVLFHNGKEMTSEDVVASLRRWGQYGQTAKALWSHVVDLQAIGTYAVQMTLDQPFAPMTTYLANIYGGAVIYPKEIAESAGAKPLAPEQVIGTGPYKLVEWRPGESILLERFAGYVPSSLPASGFSGQKIAYFDRLQFFPVTEPNARVIGLQANTYDYAANIPSDLAVSVEGNPSIVQIIVDHPPIYPIALVNNKQGIMTNSALKRAILTALDMDAVMAAGYGDQKYWALNPSYFAPGIRWYTEGAGAGLYDQGDPTLARSMAQAAGYKGEPVKMIVASSMTEQYNQAVVVQDQLQKAGFTVDLQVYDLASFFTVRNNVADPQWDLAFSFYSTTPDPSLVLMLSPTYAGWWNTPEIQDLGGELNQLIRFEDRYEQWVQIMTLWYEQVPALKFGDAFQLHLMRSEIMGGYGTTQPDMVSPYFWNAWKQP